MTTSSVVSLAAAAAKKLPTETAPKRVPPSKKKVVPIEESFNVRMNEFFKAPVPDPIRKALSVQKQQNDVDLDDVAALVTAAPGSPGIPRPLWLVILASVPTGLLWYGYYKFAVEEELMQHDLASGTQPRGFGGYGTLGPFVYGCLLGPLAFVLHLPGGLQWTNLGIAFIYYTQFLLYDRVNDLYEADGQERPLHLWWTLPILFPLDLVVGLRQVHFLSQYWYRKRGGGRKGHGPAPVDPVADFFPFIAAPKFSWQEFVLTPALWCKLLAKVDPIDEAKLPQPVQELLKLGTQEGAGNNRRSNRR
jgi:hypothetical protein